MATNNLIFSPTYSLFTYVSSNLRLRPRITPIFTLFFHNNKSFRFLRFHQNRKILRLYVLKLTTCQNSKHERHRGKTIKTITISSKHAIHGSSRYIAQSSRCVTTRPDWMILFRTLKVFLFFALENFYAHRYTALKQQPICEIGTNYYLPPPLAVDRTGVDLLL